MEPDVIAEVTSDMPIYFGLSYHLKPVGFMRITSKVELSINAEVWVDYAEGICECGMALQWDGIILLDKLWQATKLGPCALYKNGKPLFDCENVHIGNEEGYVAIDVTTGEKPNV